MRAADMVVMPDEALFERMVCGDHDTDGPSCWCQPRTERVIDADGHDTTIFYHRRFMDMTMELGDHPFTPEKPGVAA